MKLIRLAVAAAILALAPAVAEAQARFAVAVDVGAAAPLSTSAQRVVSFAPAASTSSGDANVPLLSDRRNDIGFRFAATAIISSLEVRYDFARLGWRGARVRCRGEEPATQAPDGEIEDADVAYDCSVPNEVVRYAGEDETALQMHALDVALRFYMRRRPAVTSGRDLTRLYALVGPGLVLTRAEDPELGPRLRPGVRLSLGGGAEVPVDRRVALTFGVRYMPAIVAGAASTSARANRAVAADRGVVAALFDVSHTVTVAAGVRVDFR
ncbi:MAG: hypothetical protein H6700_07120 [Myxococcales bacterium]|nr:hypothetical protein [Myxococcales bacterium]MCB9520596.1 hypothetical protein [Myxococcales bacterium]MCB9531519.1 hypothetical protein [Myxococcales bacterium]